MPDDTFLTYPFHGNSSRQQDRHDFTAEIQVLSRFCVRYCKPVIYVADWCQNPPPPARKIARKVGKHSILPRKTVNLATQERQSEGARLTILHPHFDYLTPQNTQNHTPKTTKQGQKTHFPAENNRFSWPADRIKKYHHTHRMTPSWQRQWHDTQSDIMADILSYKKALA